MEQEINIKVTGHLKVVDQNGNILYDDHNALDVNATNVIRRALTNNISQLNEVKAYKAGVLLATSSISGNTYTGDNQVTMKATFTKASFNDTVDEFRLGSSLNGIMSVVNGLSILKDSNTALSISWKLTIKT